MKKISPEKYIEGINSIYVEQPQYETGQDGSAGYCDCIGMCRGARKREGVEGVTGMNGPNYAARHTIKNLQKIKRVDQLRLGDVVLKVRDKDDKDMPLPLKYRKDGTDYSSQWGETNFTHIGTVTQVNPLRITHMTSPTAKIDTTLGKWAYFGQLPWVDYEAAPAEDQPVAGWARVWSSNGKPVKMRAKPSVTCRTWWEVPCGAEVVLTDPGETWSGIIWAGRSGWMKTEYLFSNSEQLPAYTVIITGLDKAKAEEIVGIYGGEITAG